MQPRPLTAGAFACLVLLAACSGGSGSSTTSATKAATPDSRGSSGPGCQYIVAGTEKRSTTPGKDLQYLTSAIAEPATCYDKITFEFDPGDGPDLPPGYTVEYREPPFIEGIRSSTEGFKEAKYILYIEMRPASTEDTRFSGRGITTYKGNLRLGLSGMKHTVIVEWLDKAPPSVPEVVAPTGTTTTSAPRSRATTSTTVAAPAAPTAPTAPTTTTTLAPNDPATSRVVWLIGLDSKRPFTVDASNQPPKISVLIMH
ncbi:MAG: hypothetical protein MUP67_01655 [Acidimicrobiia bacterium]|nr:hypothetical protein [Acidimicrobiia bacterium]